MNQPSLISLLIAALFTENFVLCKFLGCCPFLGVSKKTDTAVGMGMAVIFIMSLASAITWCANHFILEPFGLSYLQTIVFILIIAGLVQFVEMFMKKSMPALYSALGIYLPLITTNCAVLGAVIINMQKGYNFLYSVAFGFSAAVGFTLAIVIFAGVRAKIEYADPPKAFKGTPIALITAGLIAMAFSGFSGVSF